MRVWLLFVVVGVLAIAIDAKKKRKFEGDFEFAEEDDTRTTKVGDKKRWIHDPLSDLCRPLNCKKKEMCLLEDAFTAVCVSKKELQKNGDVVIPKSMVLVEELARRRTQDKKESSDSSDEDDSDDVFYDTEDDPEDDQEDDVSESVSCKPCPVVKPTFLCGSDNRTYSSLCRLDYHNCIHHTGIHVSCKGFCPCKDSDSHLRKKQRQSERLNSFMNKYKATLDKNGGGNRQDRYTYTPEDFKYENKHYKYIKYTKYNKDNNALYADDKDRQRGYNEVVDSKNHVNSLDNSHSVTTQQTNKCPPAALQTMGNRLLDWFSVVMADTKRRRMHSKSKAHFPVVCKGEVRWMFQHLDLDGDGRLSLQELYDLEHDQSEVCIKPFLEQCDTDHNMSVSPHEWCRCFDKTDRPCAAVKRRITPELLGVYIPSCDSQGYYRPTQCHGATGMCWCVDKHGVEFANTRTHARPNCEALINKAGDSQKPPESNSNVGSDDEDDGDDVEQGLEGSADQPLDF